MSTKTTLYLVNLFLWFSCGSAEADVRPEQPAAVFSFYPTPGSTNLGAPAPQAAATLSNEAFTTAGIMNLAAAPAPTFYPNDNVLVISAASPVPTSTIDDETTEVSICELPNQTEDDSFITIDLTSDSGAAGEDSADADQSEPETATDEFDWSTDVGDDVETTSTETSDGTFLCSSVAYSDEQKKAMAGAALARLLKDADVKATFAQYDLLPASLDIKVNTFSFTAGPRAGKRMYFEVHFDQLNSNAKLVAGIFGYMTEPDMPNKGAFSVLLGMTDAPKSGFAALKTALLPEIGRLAVLLKGLRGSGFVTDDDKQYQ